MKKQPSEKVNTPPGFDRKLLVRVRELLAARNQLLELERKTQRKLEATVRRIAEANVILGDTELSALISPNGQQISSATEELQKREKERVQLLRLLSSIRSRLTASVPALREMEQELVSQQADWASGVWQEFISEQYNPACEAFCKVLTDGKALCLSLGYPFSLPLPEHTAVGDVEMNEKYSEPWQLREQMSALLRKADGRERETAKFEGFNALHSQVSIPEGATYRFRRKQMVNGRQFQVGDIINADVIHPGLLRRLVAARQIVPTTPEAAK